MKISKNLLPALIGNIADWYEFYMYGMFAAPIIAKLFLPNENYTFALLYTYFAFAMGFIVRPFGALLLGFLSDKYGRKKVLFYSLLLMGLPTFLMGVLPTYASIGIFAPILLMIIRLLQGLAIGGEIGSAVAFILESAPQNKKNLAGALLISSSFVALLLASFISYLLLNTLSVTQLASWGWRLPFLFSFMIILMGLYVRYQSQESGAFLQLKHQRQLVANPIIDALMNERQNMLITFLLSSLVAVLAFMGITYMPTYASHYLGYDFRHMLLLSSLSIIVLTMSCIAFGYIADIYGGKKVLMLSVVVLVIFILPIYAMIINKISDVWFAMVLFALISGAVIAPIFANTSGLFPTRNRNTGFGISFNVSVAIFGGTAAMLMTFLISVTGDYYMPAYYIIVLGILFFIATWSLPSDQNVIMVFQSDHQLDGE